LNMSSRRAASVRCCRCNGTITRIVPYCSPLGVGMGLLGKKKRVETKPFSLSYKRLTILWILWLAIRDRGIRDMSFPRKRESTHGFILDSRLRGSDIVSWMAYIPVRHPGTTHHSLLDTNPSARILPP